MYEADVYYLYTMPKGQCGGCERALRYLDSKEYKYKHIEIDNPGLELGVKSIFGLVYAPFLFHPEKGIWTFSGAEDNPLVEYKIE